MCLLVFPAKDMDADKKIFRAMLGVEPYADAPYYTGFRTGDLEIGLDPSGSTTGPIAYWAVEDIKASLQQLLDAGAELVQDVRTVGPGRQMAQVKNAGGSIVGIVADA
ncbi:MAG TPA: glyoxalase [Candidatus Dormibacteraeota bacterium]|jgi:predicted enzyme related to lactoylglutathione lyase|nr:glyoxalase [Candidatus Dormibacteraeota bacterium]